MASEKKICFLFVCLFFFVFFFLENLAFQLPWQPIKISDFDKIHMVGRGLLQEQFCICTNTEINANLHFYHYKSMENSSYNSNETTWATNDNKTKKKKKKNNLCSDLWHEHVC